eukprot:m.22656 g.22656  ORF g.22656 m.22656 type:complete len:951 (-) comp5472_c0_seq1:275-3127(-)
MDDGEKTAHESAQSITDSQLEDTHPEISLPHDMEHFLHVGANNIGNIHKLCVEQQKTFEQVAHKRSRQLPKRPTSAIRDSSSPLSSSSSSSVLTSTPVGTPVKMRGAANTSKLRPTSTASLNRLSLGSPMPSSSSSSRLTPKKGLRGLLKGDSSSSTSRLSSGIDHFLQVEAFFVKATMCIESDDVKSLHALINKDGTDINQPNDDGHTLLDVAVLLNSPGCIRFLMLSGGVEKESYANPAERKKGMEILHQAKQIATANIASDLLSGKTDQYSIHSESKASFEQFDRLYRKWNLVKERAGLPSAPQRVRVRVVGADRVEIVIDEAVDPGGAPITKYKVYVSGDTSFSNPTVLHIPSTVTHLILRGHKEGSEVHIRVASVNVRGCGPAVRSSPPFVIPQSTRHHLPPYSILKECIDAVSQEMEENGLLEISSDTSKFGSTLKLTKPSKKGMYVCMCAYDESDTKTVCTVSGLLPCVRVNRDMQLEDLHEAIKFLQLLSFSWASSTTMANFTSEIATVDLRKGVAECVAFLQMLFKVTDLGHVYYNVITEEATEASIVVIAMSILHSKKPSSLAWTPIPALKISQVPSLCAAMEDIIAFSEGCSTSMDQGLYLGCLFPHNVVGGLRVSVEKHCVNTIPAVKLRNNSFVSREEWEDVAVNSGKIQDPGCMLTRLISHHTPNLLSSCAIEQYRQGKFRVFADCVVDVSDEVSFVLIVPDQEYSWDTTATARAISSKHTHISSKTLDLLMLQRFTPSICESYARMSIITSNAALSCAYDKRTCRGAERGAFQRKEDCATSASKRLEDAWSNARLFSNVIRWAKSSDNATVMTLETLRGSYTGEAQDHEVRNVDGDGDGSGLQVDMNVHGAGVLDVYSTTYGTRKHRLTVPFYSSVSDIISLLLHELGLADTVNAALFRQRQDTGFERRMKDFARPLLLKHRYELRKEKFVLKTE